MSSTFAPPLSITEATKETVKMLVKAKAPAEVLQDQSRGGDEIISTNEISKTIDRFQELTSDLEAIAVWRRLPPKSKC